jgi:hypothetical protein
MYASFFSLCTVREKALSQRADASTGVGLKASLGLSPHCK